MSTTELKLNGTTVLSENNSTINLVTTTANIGTNALVVSSDGKVGIGTSSPSRTLSVRNGSDNQIRVENGASATQSYEFGRNGTTGLLTFYGNQTGYTGYVFSGVDGERMRIDSSGNVGIGVAAPDVPLQVKGVIEAQATNSTNGWMMYTYTDNSFRLNYNGAGNDEVVITDNGYVGIGTAAPTSKLYVVDGGGIFDVQDSTGHARFTQASGSAQIGLFRSGASAAGGGYIGGDGSYLLNVFNTSFSKKATIDHSGNLNISGSYGNISDIRVKENITDYTKGITELMQIHVRQWQYNGKGDTNIGQNGVGVIADEIENVLPSTVGTYPAKLNADDEIETDIKRFAASEITWLLVNTCKEQQTIIESQQSQIDELTTRIEALESN